MKPPQPYATAVANGSCQLMKRAAVHSSQAFPGVAGVETNYESAARVKRDWATKKVWLVAIGRAKFYWTHWSTERQPSFNVDSRRA